MVYIDSKGNILNCSPSSEPPHGPKDGGKYIHPRWVIPPRWAHKPKAYDNTYKWCYQAYAPSCKGDPLYERCKAYYDAYANPWRETFPKEVPRSRRKRKERRKPNQALGAYEKLLNENGIFSRKDWKRWMLKNHPDKNGEIDSELVGAINTAVGRVFE